MVRGTLARRWQTPAGGGQAMIEPETRHDRRWTMSRIEPYRSWLALEERAASEPNELHRRLITEVRNHMEFEIRGELDSLMDTLIEHPVYHFYNATPLVLDGYEAVRTFYENLFASGGNQFEMVLERIVVDDGAVVTAGRVKQVYTGKMATAMGFAEVGGKPVTHDDLILSTSQLITVWPAGRYGKLVGEDVYLVSRAAERIQESDLPDYFRR